MTYEIQESSMNGETIEQMHSRLATDHGRDNVFVTEGQSGAVIGLVGRGFGDLNPEQIEVIQE